MIHMNSESKGRERKNVLVHEQWRRHVSTYNNHLFHLEEVKGIAQVGC